MENEEKELDPNEEDSEPQEDSEQEDVVLDESSLHEENPPLKIHHGEALTLSESTAITYRNRTQIILIAGPVKSGKTTLIASLFHLFQRGPFIEYQFAGSETLLGFDKRCHLARTASRRVFQDTPITHPYIDRQLLHLRLRHIDVNSPIKDLLFYDISGENYDNAKNSLEECKDLDLLNRFDHLVLLIDGEKITQVENRQKAFSDTRMLLRSFRDSNIINQEALVDILFTKWDLIEPNVNKSEHEEFIEHIKESISNSFKDSLGRLRFFNIASRQLIADCLWDMVLKM